MKQTTTAMNYSFNKGYYENFLSNRVSAITGSGNLNNTIKKLFIPNLDGEVEGGELINGILCIGYIDVKNYVKETYNGDKPICLDEKFKQLLADVDTFLSFSDWDNEVVDYLGNTFGIKSGKFSTKGSICGVPYNISS